MFQNRVLICIGTLDSLNPHRGTGTRPQYCLSFGPVSSRSSDFCSSLIPTFEISIDIRALSHLVLEPFRRSSRFLERVVTIQELFCRHDHKLLPRSIEMRVRRDFFNSRHDRHLFVVEYDVHSSLGGTYGLRVLDVLFNQMRKLDRYEPLSLFFCLRIDHFEQSFAARLRNRLRSSLFLVTNRLLECR